MRILVLIAFLFVSYPTFSSDTSDIEKLLMQYLTAIKNKDRDKLKATITAKYYQKLDQKDGIKILFSMQPKDQKSPIKVDIKVVKQLKDYRANIKDKSSKEYDDYWYRIVQEKDKFKIDGTFHMEESVK